MSEVLVLGVLLAGACTLRLWYLGETSLWWDEVVEISFASAPNAWSVLRAVQSGIPAGSGNAGAVPLDYLVLHAWTALVPKPSPHLLEVYYRFPSYVWSCLAVLAMWAFCRRAFGRGTALLAALLLALSVPHVLYAAEARFYSLFVLLAILNLATFARLVREPDARGAWAGYAAVAVLFFLTGLLSLLVLFWEYAYLVLRALGAEGGALRRRRLRLLGATLLVLGAVLGCYYAATPIGVRGHRPGAALLRPGDLTRQAFEFLALYDWRRLDLFLAGAVLAPLALALRRHPMLPLVLVVVAAEAASVPALARVLQWKHYYFHARHALFLLPGFVLLSALALDAAVRGAAALAPRRWRGPVGSAALAAAAALVVWLHVPSVTGYLADPHQYFSLTKTDRDFRGLMDHLRQRTARLEAGDVYLLLVGRSNLGALANPLLAWYLREHHLQRAVALVGAPNVMTMVATLRAGCDGSCIGRSTTDVVADLRLASPFETNPAKLQLLGVWPALVVGRVGAMGGVVYAPVPRGLDVAGLKPTGIFTGIGLFERR